MDFFRVFGSRLKGKFLPPAPMTWEERLVEELFPEMSNTVNAFDRIVEAGLLGVQTAFVSWEICFIRDFDRAIG